MAEGISTFETCRILFLGLRVWEIRYRSVYPCFAYSCS